MLLSVTRLSGASFIAMQIKVAYEWLGFVVVVVAGSVRCRAGSGGDCSPWSPQRGGGGGDSRGSGGLSDAGETPPCCGVFLARDLSTLDAGETGSDFTLQAPLPRPPPPPVMSRMALGSTWA